MTSRLPKYARRKGFVEHSTTWMIGAVQERANGQKCYEVMQVVEFIEKPSFMRIERKRRAKGSQ